MPEWYPLRVRAYFVWLQLVGQERRELFLRRMSPADAERVSRRVGVYLMSFVGLEIRRTLQQPGA